MVYVNYKWFSEDGWILMLSHGYRKDSTYHLVLTCTFKLNVMYMYIVTYHRLEKCPSHTCTSNQFNYQWTSIHIHQDKSGLHSKFCMQYTEILDEKIALHKCIWCLHVSYLLFSSPLQKEKLLTVCLVILWMVTTCPFLECMTTRMVPLVPTIRCRHHQNQLHPSLLLLLQDHTH